MLELAHWAARLKQDRWTEAALQTVPDMLKSLRHYPVGYRESEKTLDLYEYEYRLRRGVTNLVPAQLGDATAADVRKVIRAYGGDEAFKVLWNYYNKTDAFIDLLFGALTWYPDLTQQQKRDAIFQAAVSSPRQLPPDTILNIGSVFGGEQLKPAPGSLEARSFFALLPVLEALYQPLQGRDLDRLIGACYRFDSGLQLYGSEGLPPVVKGLGLVHTFLQFQVLMPAFNRVHWVHCYSEHELS